MPELSQQQSINESSVSLSSTSSATSAPSIHKMFRAHSSSAMLLMRRASNASKVNVDDTMSVVTSGYADDIESDNYVTSKKTTNHVANTASTSVISDLGLGTDKWSVGDRTEPLDDLEWPDLDLELAVSQSTTGRDITSSSSNSKRVSRVTKETGDDVFSDKCLTTGATTTITSNSGQDNTFLREIEISHQIDEVMKEFQVSEENYVAMMGSLEAEMERGLHRDSHASASVRMFPTYVSCLPTGTEEGDYVALDLGGTNFRVLLVHLRPGETPKLAFQVFLIPSSLMHAPGTQLFDYIAISLASFLSSRGVTGSEVKPLSLGFTFSFPCQQDSLSSARLTRWTKGFTCPGVQDNDVVCLLQEAIDRQGAKVKVKALINDNVGALLAGALAHRRCSIGLILGTGTNCCYVEKRNRIGTLNESKSRLSHDEMVINTEWGGFGDNGVIDHIRTRFDVALDKESLNPGCQRFEKMISGMYMGEIVRRVLSHLTSRGLLFAGVQSKDLSTPGCFLTKYVSEIGGDDPDGEFANTRLVLDELGISSGVTSCDCRNVQYVCWQVSQRAAFLAAAALATIVNRMAADEVAVAVDGSLFRFHPHFKDLMLWKLRQLVHPAHSVSLNLTLDGSGLGAALAAAIADN